MTDRHPPLSRNRPAWTMAVVVRNGRTKTLPGPSTMPTVFETRLERVSRRIRGPITPRTLALALADEWGTRGRGFWDVDAGIARGRAVLFESTVKQLREFRSPTAEAEALAKFWQALFIDLGGNEAADLADSERAARGLEPVAPKWAKDLEYTRRQNGKSGVDPIVDKVIDERKGRRKKAAVATAEEAAEFNAE